MEIQDDLDVLRKATGALVEWEEEKHPRGEGGKFAPKGTTRHSPNGEEKPKEVPLGEGDVRGERDEVDGHEGVWVYTDEGKWTVFLRDGETMEEARSRQIEEAMEGEWGAQAQRLAQKLHRKDEKARRAAERKGKEEERQAKAEGRRTPTEEKIVEDAKKAMRSLGASKEEAEEAVETAVKIIGIKDAGDLVSVALGGKPMGKPDPKEPPREHPKSSQAVPEEDDSAFEHFFGKPDDLEEDEIEGEIEEEEVRDIDDLFDDLFGSGEMPSPDLSREDEAALEEMKRKLLAVSEREEERGRELAEGRKKRRESR